MTIDFKATNYELLPEVRESATRKLMSLEKYLNEGKSTAHAYVELGKETEAHNNGRIWRVEINLVVAGTSFRATALEETLENALDRATAELVRVLKSAHTRKHSLMKRGGAAVKAMLRGFRS